MKKITVIGGGTGTFVVLTGIKDFKIDLGVIVTMMDSGGSTGRLRDQLGVLPPGDLRQCLVALSEAPLLWRKLFLYRFENGDLKGHNFGNIFLSALEKVCVNYNDVIETASYVLKTKGEVIPVTYEKTHLCVEYKNGKILKGEGLIEDNVNETSGIARAFLEEIIKVNPKVIDRIGNSDFIIVGPGDLYTSIIPVLLVPGVIEAIKRRKPKIIYIMNLMTKSGQTTNYQASGHLADLSKYLQISPDYILINNGNIPQNILNWYSAHNEKPVLDDLVNPDFSKNIIADNLIDTQTFYNDKTDKMKRSILRHDPQKLAKLIYKIIR